MTLLESVNLCLHALGETRVSSTDIRHPTVDLAISTIRIKQRGLLEQGKWFNTTRVRMYPNDEGRVEYPVDALTVQDACGRKVYAMRQRMLFNVTDNTAIFSAPVDLTVMYDVDFEDLPECVATVVTYRAVRAIYVGDFGNDSSVSDHVQNEQQAYLTMDMLHMRNMQYNTRSRKGFRRLRNALQG